MTTTGPRELRDCDRDEDGSVPCDPVDNGDGTATCSACGWTGGYAASGPFDARDRLTPEEALRALNDLRSNIIGTQRATWSNVAYPLVAILNAAGMEYAEPSEEQMREHDDCYGGAGGYPGNALREPQGGWCEPVGVRTDALRLARDLIRYSGLRDKVRLREDESEYAEAERLLARFDVLAARAGFDE